MVIVVWRAVRQEELHRGGVWPHRGLSGPGRAEQCDGTRAGMVNTGETPQKTGVSPNYTKKMINGYGENTGPPAVFVRASQYERPRTQDF